MKRENHVPVRFLRIESAVVAPRLSSLLLVFCTLVIPVIALAEVNAGLDVATVQEFDGLDRDRDGGLDEMEFPFSEVARRIRDAGRKDQLPGLFGRMSENGAGRIGLLGFARSRLNRNVRLLDRPASLNFIRLDKDLNGVISLAEYMERDDANKERFQKIDLNASGDVGAFEWIQGIREEFMDAKLAAMFVKLDTNDDGAISLDEFDNGKPPETMAGKFNAVDLNGNREVSPDEFAKAMSLPEGRVGLPAKVITEFEEIDRNKDNMISLREFSRYAPMAKDRKLPGRVLEQHLKRMFHLLDSDGDEELSVSEFADIGWVRAGRPARGRGRGPMRPGR
jgi:Ca2+-binding EF-hand superfamily protein